MIKNSMSSPGTALFAGLFIIYLVSLAPTIYSGDSSLFAAEAFALGTAHPPGYPLFMMIGKLFSLLPFGNVAYRVNLVSALSGALTCVMIYKAALDVTQNVIASWVSAALCGITPLFFGESVKAEVYTLNAFLSICVFYLGLKILQSEERTDHLRYALLGTFIVGLGMGNHHTIGFMGLVFAFPLFLAWRSFPFRLPLLAFMAFLSGFSVNLYLYLRTIITHKTGSLMAYSAVFDWNSFFKVLLRTQYTGSSLTALAATTHNVLGWFFGLKNAFASIILTNGTIFIPFAVIGIIFLFRKAPKLGVYLLFSLLTWLLLIGRMTMASPSISGEQIDVVSVYFIPVLGVYYTIVAVGFSGLLNLISRSNLHILKRAVPVSMFLIPLLLLPYTYSVRTQAHNYLAYDFAKDRMTVLPPKSLMVNYSDNPIFVTFYMKTVERYREDVLSMNTRLEPGKVRFELQDSSKYKYERMYPEFFAKEKSTLAELNRDFISRHALFTSNPVGTKDEFSNHFKAYPTVLSTELYGTDEPLEQIRASTFQQFTSRYNMINFERVMEMPTSYDFLDQEMADMYAFSTLVYGDLLKQDGKTELGNQLYRNAFLMTPAQRLIGPFIHYLVNDGQRNEANYFLNNMKGTSLEDQAETLRKDLLSDREQDGE